MKSLFIMGLPRGGTTVTRDLFEGISGLTVLKEVNLGILAGEITFGPVVWKSPVNCMDGQFLRDFYPDVRIVYVVKDGRQNLAAHKRHLEVYGKDYLWGAYRGLGLKGFADLWNDFAALVINDGVEWFRLEDLESGGPGELIIKGLYQECGYPGIDKALDFWRDHVWVHGLGRSGPYPRKAMSLGTKDWRVALTPQEVSWIDPGLLEALRYG